MISIIVPVYNVEKYLADCLNSILNQTYSDLEIIVVDDGSTDCSAEICQDFAKNDPRIIFIQKENGGLSDARNTGLNSANGEFVCFIDSDDMVANDFVSELYEAMLSLDADIVECRYLRFSDEENPFLTVNENKDQYEIYTPEAALSELMNGHLKPTVCNKMYRGTILTTEFELGKIHEDEFWTPVTFAKAKRIVELNRRLYYYRENTESIMGQGYSLKRLDGLEAFQKRIMLMHEYFPTLENEAVKKFCISSMNHYQKLTAHNALDPHQMYRSKIYKGVKKYYKSNVYHQWTLKRKIWLHFFILLPQLYSRLRNKLNITA